MSRLDIDSIAGKIAKEILSEQQSEEEERQDVRANFRAADQFGESASDPDDEFYFDEDGQDDGQES